MVDLYAILKILCIILIRPSGFNFIEWTKGTKSAASYGRYVQHIQSRRVKINFCLLYTYKTILFMGLNSFSVYIVKD